MALLIVGDSLSVGESSPTFFFIEELRRRGKNKDAKIEVNALVGRSSRSYVDEGMPGLDKLDSGDILILFLGTNDCPRTEKGVREDFTTIIKEAKKRTEKLACIMPPTFPDHARASNGVSMVEGRKMVVKVLSELFSNDEIVDPATNPKDLNSSEFRQADGIHFKKKGSKELGKYMAEVVFTKAGTETSYTNVVVPAVIAASLIFVLLTSKR